MKSRKKLVRQIAPLFFALALVSLVSFSVYAAILLRSFHIEQIRWDLEAISLVAGEQVGGLMTGGQAAEVDALVKTLGGRIATRITVVLPDGTVLGDSGRDPQRMENHADRPEIIEAMRGGIGSSTRYSSTTRKKMMYVAVPVEIDGRIGFTLRSSLPVTTIAQALQSIYIDFFLGGLLIVLLAVLLAVLFSRKIVRPLEELKHGAERFAGGDFSRRLPVPDSAEIGELAETMNRMANELDARIQTVVDPRMKIISINQACGDIIGLEVKAAEGLSLPEAVRNRELHVFAARTLAGDEACETEIVLHHDGERILQAHGTQLRDSAGQRIGAPCAGWRTCGGSSWPTSPTN